MEMPQFAPSDWIIYDRCDFVKPSYAPYGFSVYSDVPCRRGTTVFTFDRRRRLQFVPERLLHAESQRANLDAASVCQAIQVERQAFLRERCPLLTFASFADNATAAVRQVGRCKAQAAGCSSHFIDFARLATAPNVIIGSGGSTWALWSAVAGADRVFFGQQSWYNASLITQWGQSGRRVFTGTAMWKSEGSSTGVNVSRMLAWMRAN